MGLRGAGRGRRKADGHITKARFDRMSTRLRIWGSGVRIPSGAPYISLIKLIFIGFDCGVASTKFSYGSNMEAGARSCDALFLYKAANTMTVNERAPSANVSVERRGCFVRGGKWFFPAVKRDVSQKPERKSRNTRFKKTSTARRKTVRRQTTFKSDDWYEKAMLSFAISANS
jgi:hypothetical protein